LVLVVFISVIVILLALPVAPVLLRQRGMKKFAQTHNLNYLGKKLADGLVLRKTYFGWRSEDIANSMTGSLGGAQVAIADFAFATQKKLLRQTLVAFRRDDGIHWSETPSEKTKNLHLEVSGEWLIAYMEGHRVEPDELWDWCAELRKLALQQTA
jgi:hypothetical protein